MEFVIWNLFFAAGSSDDDAGHRRVPCPRAVFC
jgi:hypothetical protein